MQKFGHRSLQRQTRRPSIINPGRGKTLLKPKKKPLLRRTSGTGPSPECFSAGRNQMTDRPIRLVPKVAVPPATFERLLTNASRISLLVLAAIAVTAVAVMAQALLAPIVLGPAARAKQALPKRMPLPRSENPARRTTLPRPFALLPNRRR